MNALTKLFRLGRAEQPNVEATPRLSEARRQALTKGLVEASQKMADPPERSGYEKRRLR